jgi:hypothetical protein
MLARVRGLQTEIRSPGGDFDKEAEMQDDKTQGSEPAERRNSQSDHHGKAHRPEDFDALNPQKQAPEKDLDKED